MRPDTSGTPVLGAVLGHITDLEAIVGRGVAQVSNALRSSIGFDLVGFAGFAVDAEAQERLATGKVGATDVALLLVNPDLLVGDSLKFVHFLRDWSEADDEPDDLPTQRFTPRRITAAALARCLVVIAAAGTVAFFAIRGAQNAEPMAAAHTFVVVTAAPASPSAERPRWSAPPTPKPREVADAKTLEPPAPPKPLPKPVITVAQLAAYDRQFIANLRANLWTIWDPARMAEQAHWVCGKLEDGLSPFAVSQSLFGISPGEQQSFVSTAMATYPSCP